MELHYRKGSDAFVPEGAYRALEARLRGQAEDFDEIPVVSLARFDRKTRLLPFVLYDKMMFPGGARTVAAAMHQAGFTRARAVFQLWNPNFRPSRARIDGRAPQLLLVSTMELNCRMAYEAIKDAWLLGEDRPLILVGGAKSFHQPYQFWTLPTPQGPVAPDAAITGEAYILLDLLNLLMEYRLPGEHLRRAFERARQEGALDSVPGLVYLAPDANLQEPVLVDTGLQRLVQHLDELPDEVVGLSLLEAPHRGSGLSPAPLAANKLRYHSRVVGMQITQGCKFNCSYCPIPALNQKTWRYRSAENLVHQFCSVRERFGVKYFFGADDNFLNRRQTAEEYFEALAAARVFGHKRLGQQIRWGTEATQFDTYKNRDLLPLAARSGLFAIWFGIEDLTAELINKGQRPEVTRDLFQIMHAHKICPMAMIMFHEGQPYSSPGSLYGLKNQMDFLRQAGAVSVQITNHIPAVGTREYDKTYATGKVLKSLGDFPVTESQMDGNYVIVQGADAAWKRQLKFLAGYFSFYNPLNFFRALKDDGSPLRRYQVGYQIAGLVGAVRSTLKTLPYIYRLMTKPATYHDHAPPLSRVPVRLAPGAFPRFPDKTFYAADVPEPLEQVA